MIGRLAFAFLLALACLPARGQTIGAFGAPSLQCVQQQELLSNNVFPGGAPTATTIGNITVPTNSSGSGTTLDPSFNGLFTYSNGNLTATGGSASGYAGVRSTTSKVNGYLYWRDTVGGTLSSSGHGFANATWTNGLNLFSAGSVGIFPQSGEVAVNGVMATTVATATTGDFLDTALDIPDGEVWFRTVHSGTAGNWNNSGSASPTNNVGGISTTQFGAITIPYFITFNSNFQSTSDTVTINPTPALSTDVTLTGGSHVFSPWQTTNVVSCATTSLTLGGTDAAKFQLSAATAPATLETNGTVVAGTYHITLIATTSGAQNSPLSCVSVAGATCGSPVAIIGTSGGVEDPGPSSALFGSPFYTCLANYYVSTTGSDSANGSIGSPWLTIQHADTLTRSPGDCINVEAGTYAAGARITQGGNAATATGYVVYRCVTLNACKITENDHGFLVQSSGNVGPNYLVFDGFELAASSEAPFGQGIEVWDGNPNGAETTFSVHHIWILNNLIHGYGQSGTQTNDGEYFYLIHNTIYNNSNVTCGAQGSGISVAVPKAIPTAYSRTTMDQNFSSFNIAVMFNATYNNILTQCGTANNPTNTDGNGIILDTFNNTTLNVPYPNPTLVYGNVTYQNGAKGIQIFRASSSLVPYIVVSNNTAYDNNLDPFNNGTARSEISLAGVQGGLAQNNITYPVPATSSSDSRCQSTSPCYLQYNSAIGAGSSGGVSDLNNIITNNVTFGGTPLTGQGPNGNTVFLPDTMNCTALGANQNQCNVDPTLAAVSSANFALNGGSPAISYGAGGVAGLYSLVSASPTGQYVDSGACYHTLTTCP